MSAQHTPRHVPGVGTAALGRVTNPTARQWAVTFLQAKLGGPHRGISELIAQGHTPEEIVEQWNHMHDGELWREGLGGYAALKDCNVLSHDPADIFERGVAAGGRLILPGDAQWPAQLGERFQFLSAVGEQHPKAKDPAACLPLGLWVRGGNLAELTRRAMAIVGTRTLDRYGHDVTRSFVTELCAQGYTIVSGGALGVDAIAHRTALEHGVPTIAVLACGIDQVYPAKHRALFHDIVDAGGAVVSEYCAGIPPGRHRFLTRNRLVAALAVGTIVTEAPWRSGALNTLSWAAALGTVPMAVPGPVNATASRGCLEAIRQGRANQVSSVAEVLELCAPLGTIDAEEETAALFPARAAQQLSRLQLTVLDAVGHEPAPTETVARRAGVAEDAAGVVLLELEKLQLVTLAQGLWALPRLW
ncbi:DNA-protecting protein DprA [Corynebacterium sp. 13CS0277]|uniref:DNA-processing protein DprA n=1 Tax=Corynebacterium sp. 13CS0277 TaxID=2071994 RepID=UPI000D040BF5|nr:DNA-processing protein DprA [Corynebacterium sp. 13CS0277]PRQ12562.1 DNA-protecting protein DprA [Corynebacterium sp. 13CS0277]